MTLTPKQHAARYKGIGGSDAAAALGIAPPSWKTRYQLWHEKTQHEGPAPDRETTERMEFGTLFEDGIAKRLATVENAELVRINKTLVSPEFPWMIGHIDRAYVTPAVSKRVRWHGGRLTTNRIAEIKNVGFLGPEWGEEGSDEVPLHYLVQCIHYIIVTGVEACTLAVCVGGNRLARFNIPRRPDTMEMVIEGEREFWRLVETGTPPDTTTLRDVRLRWPTDIGSAIEATPEIAAAVDELRALRARSALLAEDEERCEAKIRSFMGENAKLTVQGVAVATWKTSKPGLRVDGKLLQEQFPEVYSKVTVEKSASRPFLLKEVSNAQ